jgi:hypothetical protein
MPLSGPVIATAAILKFLVMYNQYLWPLMVVQQEAHRPSWWAWATSSSSTAWGEVMAYLTAHHRAGAGLLPGAATRLHRVDRIDGRERLMVIALEDKWIWDSWYAHDGDTWHAFFLQGATSHLATRSCGTSTSAWATRSADDLSHWEHLGTCFAPAEGPAWDDYTTWTGSWCATTRGCGTCSTPGRAGPRMGLPADRPCHVLRPARLAARGRRALPRPHGPERGPTSGFREALA